MSILIKKNGVVVPLVEPNIQLSTMPTATIDYINRIVQYTGATTNDYTHGYFYQCTEDNSTTPSTYSWVQLNVQPGGSATVRNEIAVTTETDFRQTQGAYSFKTTTAVTITLADASTITIPANIQGIFDVGETDTTLNDYVGLIQYTNNGYEKKIYFNSSVFYIPSTDNVQIDDTTASSATTYSSSKIETIIGSSKAPQMTGATAYQDGKEGLVTKPVAGDNNKALFGDGQYHTIYAANTGSVIVATTNEPDLYGRPVTLTAGSTTMSGTFSAAGECVFNNLAVYGAVQITTSDSQGNLAKGSTNITYFGTYVVGVGFNFATIKYTSTDIALAGTPVSIYYGSHIVAETSLASDGQGGLQAVCYVEKLGIYKAVAQTSDGTARANVTVTALKQTYTAELIAATIYGFKINKTDSNPATCVTPYNLGDYDVLNATYTPVHMDYVNDAFNYGSWPGLETCDRSEIFFAPKPCMLNYDGTVAYYLDPTDYTKKADGTASDIDDMSYTGNVMVEFPTVWIKRWDSGDYTYVLIADKQVDIDFHAYAHHDVNGDVLPYIYRAAYDGSYDGTRLRSISGIAYHNANTLTVNKIMSNTTRQQEINFAKANDDVSEQGEGWYILHKAEWDMLNDLLLLIGMSTDMQTTYGRGKDSGYSSATNAGIISTGTMNDKGMFWGENAGGAGVKVLGIENHWSNLWKSCSGWMLINNQHYIKMTIGTEDGSTATSYNTDGTGYIATGESITANGYISNWTENDNGFLPTAASGSSSTYRCDCVWQNNSTNFALVGGHSGDGVQCGAFYMDLTPPATRTLWCVGAALSYKPLAS